MLVYNLAILEYRLEGKLSVELELHLVKAKVWVVWAGEYPTRIPNKV
jgi:hypothetical protein